MTLLNFSKFLDKNNNLFVLIDFFSITLSLLINFLDKHSNFIVDINFSFPTKILFELSINPKNEFSIRRILR